MADNIKHKPLTESELSAAYTKAAYDFSKTSDWRELLKLADRFRELDTYKDSAQMYGRCIKAASAPAYREIALAPHPNRCLGFADASIESRNGFVRAHWYYKGDVVYYEFEIPNGVTAHITLPSGYKADLTGGIYHFAE